MKRKYVEGTEHSGKKGLGRVLSVLDFMAEAEARAFSDAFRDILGLPAASAELRSTETSQSRQVLLVELPQTHLAAT